MIMSPRISFSDDLQQMDNTIPVEQFVRSNSSPTADFDFNFCMNRKSFDQESSSADELFCNGKILPIEIKKSFPPPKKLDPPLISSQSFKETKMVVSESDEKQNTKSSFWGFKRSSSLNNGGGYGRSLCPLPILSRSNSTGSAKDNNISNKQQSKKFSSVASMKHSQSSSSNGHQKPPLKKNYGSQYGNGVKFTPVLNVPSASLFGLGSVFSSAKEKNKKK